MIIRDVEQLRQMAEAPLSIRHQGSDAFRLDGLFLTKSVVDNGSRVFWDLEIRAADVPALLGSLRQMFPNEFREFLEKPA